MRIKHNKGYSTHNTLLLKAVNACKGNVVEFGGGFFSTPLLHWVCKDLGKNLVTLENDTTFYDFTKQFRSKSHKVIFIEDWDDFKADSNWGVVFIDHDQPYQRRGYDAIRFKDVAEFIVIHDTEHEKLYGYDEVWSHFKYRYDWKECRPWTSVISNLVDVTKIL